MNGPDYARALADFWMEQGKALLKAQETTAATVAEGMKAMASGKFPSLPGAPTDLSAVTAELAQANDALVKLWSAASATSGELAKAMNKHVAGKNDGVAASVIERMTDPRQWMAGMGELDDVLSRMSEGPRLADLWDIERRYARVMQAWLEVRRVGLEHNRIILDAWMRAGKRFTEELAGHAGAEGKPLDQKRAFALWTEVANRELLHTQRSDPFLQAQREVIRAGTELRLAQQDLVEHFGKQYGFPTRTELDDVHRTLTNMRREMRRINRALRDAQAAQQPAQAQPEQAAAPPPSLPPPGAAPLGVELVAPLPAEAPEPVAPKSAPSKRKETK